VSQRGCPELVAVETSVCEDQHVRFEVPEKPRGEGVLAGLPGPQRGCHDGVGSALAQTNHSDGPKRARSTTPVRVTEFFVVLRRIRGVENHPIDRHHPP